MRPLRFVALGDSLTEGVGDPVGEGWRGWAALLVDGLSDGPDTSVEFTNLAVSGAQTRDVLERQTPAALALGPDVVSVVIGVNDTLRCTFDIHAVAARLDQVYAAFRAQGAVLLDRMPAGSRRDARAAGGAGQAPCPAAAGRQQLPRTARPSAMEPCICTRREGAWLTDRAMWSAERLHPGAGAPATRPALPRAARTGGRRHRGHALGRAEFPAPTRSASLWWLATAGTGWVARRCTDLLPQLLTLAAAEVRHRARGTSARLDLSASHAVASALAALSVAERPDAA